MRSGKLERPSRRSAWRPSPQKSWNSSWPIRFTANLRTPLRSRQKLAEVTPIHADERDRAVAAGRGGVPKGQLQKCRELRSRHLAGAHGELTVPNAPQSAPMAIDGIVAGRISEDKIHPLTIEKTIKALAPSGVATEQAMSIEQPQIARAGGRRHRLGQGRRLIGEFALRIGTASPRLLEHEIDFGQREAGNLNAEVEVHERLKLDGEQLVVPTGVKRQLVVGDHVGLPLSLIEVRQPQRRHALHLKQPCSLDPPMSRNDLTIVANQDRVGEAEPADAIGNLPDLFFNSPAAPALLSASAVPTAIRETDFRGMETQGRVRGQGAVKRNKLPTQTGRKRANALNCPRFWRRGNHCGSRGLLGGAEGDLNCDALGNAFEQPPAGRGPTPSSASIAATIAAPSTKSCWQAGRPKSGARWGWPHDRRGGSGARRMLGGRYRYGSGFRAGARATLWKRIGPVVKTVACLAQGMRSSVNFAPKELVSEGFSRS